MPQQGINLWCPAAKGNKRLQRGPASPPGEHLVAKARAHHGRQDALLLEQAVGVSRKDLGPQVAVVARGIAAGENVAESMRTAVLHRLRNHRDFASYLLQQLERRCLTGRKIVMQKHVE